MDLKFIPPYACLSYYGSFLICRSISTGITLVYTVTAYSLHTVNCRMQLKQRLKIFDILVHVRWPLLGPGPTGVQMHPNDVNKVNLDTPKHAYAFHRSSDGFAIIHLQYFTH
jgi:hypothetical protein